LPKSIVSVIDEEKMLAIRAGSESRATTTELGPLGTGRAR
jgi:hypothetical protein